MAVAFRTNIKLGAVLQFEGGLTLDFGSNPDAKVVESDTIVTKKVTIDGKSWTYKFLKYVGGRTTVAVTDDDVLTGPMSGCPLAVFTGTGAKRGVAHVGTIGGSTDEALKQNFCTYAQTKSNVKVFNPFAYWNTDANTEPNSLYSLAVAKYKNLGGTVNGFLAPTNYVVLALLAKVQGAEECYSIGLVKDPNATDKWVCLGTVQTNPLTGEAFKKKMGAEPTLCGTAATLLTAPAPARLAELQQVVHAFGGPQQLSVMLGEYRALAAPPPRRVAGCCPGRVPAASKQRVQALREAFKPYGGPDALQAGLLEFAYMQSLV